MTAQCLCSCPVWSMHLLTYLIVWTNFNVSIYISTSHLAPTSARFCGPVTFTVSHPYIWNYLSYIYTPNDHSLQLCNISNLLSQAQFSLYISLSTYQPIPLNLSPYLHANIPNCLKYCERNLILFSISFSFIPFLTHTILPFLHVQSLHPAPPSSTT